MFKALSKARRLNGEDLTTVYGTCCLVLRNEVYWLDVATYITLVAYLVNVNLHNTHLGSVWIVEGVTCGTTCRDILNVDVGNYHAVVAHEALANTQHPTELSNNSIACKHEVARRLAMAR